jgi:hypothetical protein
MVLAVCVVAGWFDGGRTGALVAAGVVGVVVGVLAVRRSVVVTAIGLRERRWFDVREMRWQNLVLLHVGPVGPMWNAQVVAVYSRIGAARALAPTRARSMARRAAIESIVAGISAVPTLVDQEPWRQVRPEGAQAPPTRSIVVPVRVVIALAFGGLAMVRCAQLTTAVGGSGRPPLGIEVVDLPAALHRPPPGCGGDWALPAEWDRSWPVDAVSISQHGRSVWSFAFPGGGGKVFTTAPFLATLSNAGPTSFYVTTAIDSAPSATFTVTIRGAGHVVTVDCP